MSLTWPTRERSSEVLLLLQQVEPGEGVGAGQLVSIVPSRLSMEAGGALAAPPGLEVSRASR